MYIVYSHGRVGSTLLAELIGCHWISKNKPKEAFPGKYAKDKYVLWDPGDTGLEELSKYPVIHTHFFGQCRERYGYLPNERMIIYCARRSLTETVASSWIAETSGYWQHYTHFKDSREPGQHIDSQLKVPHGYVKSIVQSAHGIVRRYNQGKEQGWNAHLVVYEDWIHNFQALPIDNFQYNQELNLILSKKMPVDKKKLIDYNDLNKKIKLINNGQLELEL